uniref:UBR-type domain-containing protein n=1 Tax=Panagrolaimus sp. JU765 TaxID=591449 RepID=A0AC34QZG2_9BILA
MSDTEIQENGTDEPEELVTINDIDALLHSEEARFAGLNDAVCTFSEGYIRQEVFSCLTCFADKNQVAGVCFACANECHNGHELVELYTRRQFACDCGNEKFANECKLEDKDRNCTNKYNKYGENFSNKWCVCKKSYPPEEDAPEADSEMIMCAVCENWYHDMHLKIPEDWAEYEELICKDCVKRLPFLLAYENGIGDKADQDCKIAGCEEIMNSEPRDLMFQKCKEFRESLCKCSKCLSLYDTLDCAFLTDYDESAVKYNLDRDKDLNKKKPTAEIVEKVKTVYGADVAVHVSRGIEMFKTVLGKELNALGEGGIVTKENVKRIFTELNEIRAKRPRLEEYPDAEL